MSLCPGLRVFLASLAVDLAARCWSFRAPLWLGPSCLDTEADAPLTGDRTGVSGESLESVSFRFWGLTRFGDFMAEKKQMIVDRERSQIEADEIFRLMQGNGNQSRINDGKLSPS